MQSDIKLGLIGLGTVGQAVFKLLQQNNDTINQKSGCDVKLIAVSARDKLRDRGLDLSNVEWFDNPMQIAESSEINTVIELIGGADGVAKDIAEATLKSGKNFITANKALIAHHGYNFAQIADGSGSSIGFEAAITAGLPTVSTVKHGLSGDNITKIHGILNGTCNYILDKMYSDQRDFNEILSKAQELGYAESDPAFDIDGIDALHKITILACLAFNSRVDVNKVRCIGIRGYNLQDINHAAQLGYRIRLIAYCEYLENGNLSIGVEPSLVREDAALAMVRDVYNAVLIDSEALGDSLYYGHGAGGMATAVGVISDIIATARSGISPFFSGEMNDVKNPALFSYLELESSFYLRFTVSDKKNVVAEITSLLGEHGISIDSLLQNAERVDGDADIVITTHICKSKDIENALRSIKELDNIIDMSPIIKII